MEYATKALALNEGLAEAHTVLALENLLKRVDSGKIETF